MLRKLANYIVPLSKILIVVSLVVIILLSFYWNLGFESFEIKSIFTLDTGLLSISVDPEFCLALIGILLFYVGYRLYVSREPSRAVKTISIETRKEIMNKYLLSIALGTIGLWFAYNEFSKASIWSYHLPSYVQISRGSFALRVNAVIALLLLLIWFSVIKMPVRFGYGKETSKGQ